MESGSIRAPMDMCLMCPKFGGVGNYPNVVCRAGDMPVQNPTEELMDYTTGQNYWFVYVRMGCINPEWQTIKLLLGSTNVQNQD